MEAVDWWLNGEKSISGSISGSIWVWLIALYVYVCCMLWYTMYTPYAVAPLFVVWNRTKTEMMIDVCSSYRSGYPLYGQSWLVLWKWNELQIRDEPWADSQPAIVTNTEFVTMCFIFASIYIYIYIYLFHLFSDGVLYIFNGVLIASRAPWKGFVWRDWGTPGIDPGWRGFHPITRNEIWEWKPPTMAPSGANMINMSNGRESVSCWKMLEMPQRTAGAATALHLLRMCVCVCVCVHWLFVNT